MYISVLYHRAVVGVLRGGGGWNTIGSDSEPPLSSNVIDKEQPCLYTTRKSVMHGAVSKPSSADPADDFRR